VPAGYSLACCRAIDRVAVKLTHAVLHQLHLPLVAPFRTSFGTENSRQALLVQVVGPETEGWGECVADKLPLYSSEYSDGAAQIMKRFLLPRLDPNHVVAATISRIMAPVSGHPMAKGGIEAAVLDAECRLYGQPLSERLGATKDRVPSGVAVGIHDSIPALLDTVEGYVAEGYLRIKLKIEPGNDVAQVAAVRERFPDILLQVDANCAYTLADAAVLARLDPFELLLIEQPLPADDVRGHAQLAQLVRTPICLDESITSPRAAHARSLSHYQHQTRPGRWLPRSGQDPRHLRRCGHRRVVRRHARNRHWSRRQRRAGRVTRLHASGRYVGLVAILPSRYHRSLRVGSGLPACTHRTRHWRRPDRRPPRRMHRFHRNHQTRRLTALESTLCQSRSCSGWFCREVACEAPGVGAA
jgi:o-succinylbenzoate synthase